MPRLLFLLTILCFQLHVLMAQKKTTVSGCIKDAGTGEVLTGAVIYEKTNPQNGVSPNAYGFYSITIPGQGDTLIVYYIGYEKKIIALNISKDTIINIALAASAVNNLQSVTVSADKNEQNNALSQMGVIHISVKDIEHIPVFFGEQDIMKTLQLMPGVKSSGDGNAGFYVRGGSTDQNLVLLDEAPVYNSGHLLGFFSTFNSDAIKDATLYKGGMPAEYGGRLASVVDVKMKDGNDKDFSVSGGIGLITSRITIEGPIKKNRGSFIVSGRFAYPGFFARLSSDSNTKNSTLYFYDANVKANYSITDRDKIFLSGYFGRDLFDFNTEYGISWGNITATLRWNHIFNDRVFSNTSFFFNNYNYETHGGKDSTFARVLAGIQDVSLKEDLQYYPNQKNTLHFGFNMIYHTFIPGQISAIPSNPLYNFEVSKEYAIENAVYASNEQRITSFFKMAYGIRLSGFTALGPETTYSNYDINQNPQDSAKYGKGKPVATYLNAEPRLAMNFIVDEQNSIKITCDRNSQFIHQLTNSTSTNPTDRWIPSSKIVKPEISDQAATGYFGNFLQGGLQPSVEVYYKYMQNEIDYKSGANLGGNRYVESQLVFGNGWSYGVEAMLKYNVWKFHGWAAYTWSRTMGKYPDIDNNVPFFAKEDRTHEISLVAMCDITRKWNVSTDWVFYTGNAVTYPSGNYEVGGVLVPLYTTRNGGRMPNYHRLDIGATVQLKKHKRWSHSLNMSLYNVYGRENAYAINFQTVVNANGSLTNEAVRLSLFRWVPSITYNFKFL